MFSNESLSDTQPHSVLCSVGEDSLKPNLRFSICSWEEATIPDLCRVCIHRGLRVALELPHLAFASDLVLIALSPGMGYLAISDAKFSHL